MSVLVVVFKYNFLKACFCLVVHFKAIVATSVTHLHERTPSSLGMHSMMRQPKLPGTEKFKFATSERHRPLSTSQASEPSETPQYTFHSRTSSISSQSELRPIASTLSVPTLNRSESKRRAILPITRKKTCRMLTNTNLELNIDHADIIHDGTLKVNGRPLESTRIPSCPNLENSSGSLNSSKSSLDTYFRKMSLQNSMISELPPNFDWKNIRAPPSRLSASCSSCCSSEENVWVLREDSES